MENDFLRNPIIRPHSNANDIYIGRKKPLESYYSRVEKLLDSGVNQVIIHGSGMAIPAALDLFNKSRSLFKNHTIETSSVRVIDEINKSTRIRTIPAVHISLILK